MKFRVLGTIEANQEEGPIPLPPKPRHLLAILLSQQGNPVSTDRLIDVLWGERPPRTVRKNLQVQVCSLRRLFTNPRRIVRCDAGYVLPLGPGELDVPVFEQLLAKGRACLGRGHITDGIEVLRQALALWRGPAYDGLTTLEGVFHERSRLTELRLAAMEDVHDAEISLGRHREILPEIHRDSQEHPYRERLLGQLIMAMCRDGQPNRALALYHDRRELFVRELGSEPGQQLQTLYQAILNEDPHLTTTPAVPARLPKSADGHR
ncbi:AfsR/SARP family transcriptional regulator [Streptosporangium sp. CA-135522]|uniref:AfsR/SARP family transcriptional regulator n=1 Tax=Streptosporangium sp. CA-135522 TaxID=3240072 RepID=UPI003D8FADC3